MAETHYPASPTMTVCNRLRVAVAGLGTLSAAACASTPTAPGPITAPPAAPTPAAVAPPAPFNVGVAVPGTPNITDATFLSDQQRLFDSSQFNDPNLYPPGYHWKIDSGVGPHGVVSAKAVYDSQAQQWAIVIDFTQSAAQHFGADTQAAYQASPGTAASHIAFFVGNQVISAPLVAAPSSSSTHVSGSFTQQQALALVAAILTAAHAT